MSQETINIAYDGEVLRTGSMDVRDLAPALLAVGRLCERANAVLNEDRTEISVKVRSDFKTACFEIHIDVSQKLIETARLIFSHKDQIATANTILNSIGLISGGVIFSSVSLFKLIKWLQGRKAEKTTVLENGATRIYIDNSTHIDVRPEVVRLYNDEEVRNAIRDIIKPLEREGIDAFEVREKSVAIDTIKREDLPAFKSLAPKDVDVPIIEDPKPRNAALVVLKTAFEDDLKWMFSDGEARFQAAMTDADFLDKISNRQVSFTKGDVLVVSMLSKSFQTTTGLRTEHTIIKVDEVRHAPRQLNLLPPPTPESRS